MTGSASAANHSDGPLRPRVSEEAVQRLAEAVARLTNDPDYFLEALTAMLLAMEPVSRDARLTENEGRFLIESGVFTADEWVETRARVDRGSLQVGAAGARLLGLFATRSIEDVARFLGWSEEAVLIAVSEGRLYAFEISRRLRFPAWQFDIGSPERLLPGLTEIIEIVTPRWNAHSVAAFMATPQSSLVSVGRKTPVEWLRDGGDVKEIGAIVEAADWL